MHRTQTKTASWRSIIQALDMSNIFLFILLFCPQCLPIQFFFHFCSSAKKQLCLDHHPRQLLAGRSTGTGHRGPIPDAAISKHLSLLPGPAVPVRQFCRYVLWSLVDLMSFQAMFLALPQCVTISNWLGWFLIYCLFHVLMVIYL